MSNGFDSITTLHMQIHREAAGCCCLDDDARCPRCPTANHAELASGKINVLQAENERLRVIATEVLRHIYEEPADFAYISRMLRAALQQEQPA